ncbi:MAG TPA: head GIN domain-containing protein, partial [Chitinophagaceae bacterium]|nr:head GIN domain-containing protein [Chitinophagaceae bacterium]
SSFHGIEVATGIELSLTQGTTEEVAVSAAQPAYRDRIVTKVENGILKIYYDSKAGAINKRKETKNLKAYVSCKTLDRLQATTGAEVEITGIIKSEKLDLVANTGAIVNGQVDITTLKVNQNTGSKINLSGRAENLSAEGDTGSKFKGEDMNTASCSVTVSTGAIISVSAEKELNAKASTGAKVRYKGNAVIKEVKTNTGGSVSRI